MADDWCMVNGPWFENPLLSNLKYLCFSHSLSVDSFQWVARQKECARAKGALEGVGERVVG